jgi:hypothetical protein
MGPLEKPPIEVMKLANGAPIVLAAYDCSQEHAEMFADCFRTAWGRIPPLAKVILERHWAAGGRTLAIELPRDDGPSPKRGRGYASSSPDGMTFFCWSEVMPRIDAKTLTTTIIHELGHMTFIAIGEPSHLDGAMQYHREGLIAYLLRTDQWKADQEAADEWFYRNLNTYEMPYELRDKPLTDEKYARWLRSAPNQNPATVGLQRRHVEKVRAYVDVVMGVCPPEVAEAVRNDPKRLAIILQAQQPTTAQVAIPLLVTDRGPCPEQEKQDLLAYLRQNSHVQLPVQLLGQGWLLEKGLVKGLASIGQLVTVFRNLGNTHCKAVHDSEFFTVRQALEVFRNPGADKHPDIPQDFQKILRYKGQFAGPDSRPIVTIVEIPDGVLIADGDKTAIAGYLYALEAGIGDFILPVYYISPAPKAGS